MKFLQWLLYGAVVIQYVLYSLFVIAIIGIVIFLVTSFLLISNNYQEGIPLSKWGFKSPISILLEFPTPKSYI